MEPIGSVCDHAGDLGALAPRPNIVAGLGVGSLSAFSAGAGGVGRNRVLIVEDFRH
jgi:hypothetical protein